MRIRSFQFNPGLWPTLATISILPILLVLGFWQLDRAEQKSVLQEIYLQRTIEVPVIDFKSAVDVDSLLWRNTSLTGQFNHKYTFLLDNQVLNHRPGYYIFAVFELQNKIQVLVNRGWLAANPDRKITPEVDNPRNTVNINGVIKLVPATGILLAENTEEDLGENLFRLQQINVDDINAKHNLNLMPFVVRLDKSSVSGYIREWRQPGSGKEKHLGYAFQWFAMSAALLIIFLSVNLKKNTNDNGKNK
jgi:surfeit locus 1 family protein